MLKNYLNMEKRNITITINKARECEKLFDYETLIKEALNNEEIIKLPIVNNNFTDIL